VTVEEIGDSLDDTGRVDASLGVSTGRAEKGSKPGHLRLAFEVFHDVEEPVVHIRVIAKSDLDLVQITQGVLPSSYG